MPTSFVPTAPHRAENLFSDHDFTEQRLFFSARPELRPTPLRRLPALAARLGLSGVMAKDETERFGLNAFKGAGARFAIETLLARGTLQPGAVIACASEGNHGRAVAHAARRAGCRARVYMAASVAPARVEAIRGEGAEVTLVDGSYDDAVRAVAHDAEAAGWTIVSDTSWPGYTEIPRLIMLGYTRLMDEDWAEASDALRPPDAIFVPGGVGGLLAAVACWTDWRYGSPPQPYRPHPPYQPHQPLTKPLVVCVEPLSAACLQESARRGEPTPVAGPFDTVMGGLRCGEMSAAVFPAIRSLVDAFVAIEDRYAFEAMRRLARPEAGDPVIRCGASGAAALGGLLAALTHADLAAVRERLGLGPGSHVLALVTEGVTDPDGFAAVMARR